MTRRVVRLFPMVLLVFGVLLGARPARAIDTGDITIASLKGEVHVTMLGAERPVHVGSVLTLPATLRTGRDGAVELRQGATSVNIGPDTLLEFPALAMQGGPIDRIVQPRGNAFYSVGKRPGRKLRVETPLLVGVVKGTQFNVAVQGDSATISLFEGLLEIRAADESSVVDIKAGEVASRHAGDANIGILKMDAKAPSAPARAPAGATSNIGGAEKPVPIALRSAVADDADDPDDAHLTQALPAASLELAPAISAPVANVTEVVGVPVASVAEVVSAPVAAIPAVVNVPAASVAASVETPVSTNVGASIAANVGAPATNVAVAVEVPAGNISLGVIAAAPAPVTAGVSASVSVSPVTPTVDVSASVAVSAPAASVAVSVPGVDLSASVDLGSGNSGPGNNNGNAGQGNNGNGKGNSGTGSLNSGNSYDSVVDAVLNGQLKKPGKK